ncbi:hypothetical protein EYF80_005638 [Liparis tanakae]|uniref:Uncharacterized protein n=1 Tax=Liparis tanakae TaxID=230148 RepID=A0A4Z2J3L2_9TELE|nr:hypothetical protein EYF80_005638 [Liparis tanakae]
MKEEGGVEGVRQREVEAQQSVNNHCFDEPPILPRTLEGIGTVQPLSEWSVCCRTMVERESESMRSRAAERQTAGRHDDVKAQDLKADAVAPWWLAGATHAIGMQHTMFWQTNSLTLTETVGGKSQCSLFGPYRNKM